MAAAAKTHLAGIAEARGVDGKAEYPADYAGNDRSLWLSAGVEGRSRILATKCNVVFEAIVMLIERPY